MKVTGTTLIIAGLAIAGIPPLSGFWSKDELLSQIIMNGHPALFVAASLTGLMTAFYIFRLIFLVLFGEAKPGVRAHESPYVMTIPLTILALFSIFIGFARPVRIDYMTMGVSTVIAVLGIGLAYSFYILNNKILSAEIRARFAFLYKLLSNKYYIDEIYEAVLIKPCFRLADLSDKFDLDVVDGAVNLTARVSVIISKIQSWFDLYIVDGIVNMIANIVWLCSAIFRRIHTGLVQNYILIAFFGLAIIILIKLIGG
jgi:NADH-quinone oxidoreductase subunit L